MVFRVGKPLGDFIYLFNAGVLSLKYRTREYKLSIKSCSSSCLEFCAAVWEEFKAE